MWAQDDATLEAQGADIQEWDPELAEPEEEPEIWKPREEPQQPPKSKRRRVDRDMPPGLMLTHGSGAASSKAAGVAMVPSAAVGGNQQVAAFLQNQIKTAFSMVKAILTRSKHYV